MKRFISLVLICLLLTTQAHCFDLWADAGFNWKASGAQPSFIVSNRDSTTAARGAGTNTYTRASKAYVPDFEGRIVQVQDNSPSFPGLRSVSNLTVDSSNPPAWGKSAGTTVSGSADADGYWTITFASAGDYISTPNNPIGTGKVGRFLVNMKAGSLSTVRLADPNNGGITDLTLSATAKDYSNITAFTVNIDVFYARLTALNTGGTILVKYVQTQDVTGATNQNPSEYVATTSAPVTKWFDYANPFTVDANGVVTDSGVRTPAFAQLDAITGRKSVVFIGDSITQGAWSDVDQGLWDTYGLAALVRQNLVSRYGDGGQGFLGLYRSEWAKTGVWTQFPDYAPFGETWYGANNSALKWTLTAYGDNLDIFYLDAAGVATATYKVDGGASQNLVPFGSADNTTKKWSISLGSVGTHSIEISAPANGGGLFLQGGAVYIGTTGVVVHNIGKSGGSSGDFGYRPDDKMSIIPLISPNVCVLNFLANDYSTQTSLVNYSTRMGDIASRCVATNSSKLMMWIPPDNGLAGQPIPLASYEDIVRTVAGTYAQSMLDIHAIWGSYASNAARMYDTQHPNAVGHSDIASLILDDRLLGNFTITSQGVLSEPAGTNIFANPLAPATQGITVAAVQYTLSFYGTGSIVATGTASFTLNGTGATNRVTQTFTPTAGTLTLTLSGSVTSPQLETGAVATSPMLSSAATSTRAATVDSYPAAGNLSGSEGTAYFEVKLNTMGTGAGQMLASSTPCQFPLIDTTGQLRVYDGTNVCLSSNLSVSAGTTQKIVIKWSASGMFAFANGVKGNCASTFDNNILGTTTFNIGDGGATWINGYIGAVRIYNTALSDAECIRLTSQP